MALLLFLIFGLLVVLVMLHWKLINRPENHGDLIEKLNKVIKSLLTFDLLVVGD